MLTNELETVTQRAPATCHNAIEHRLSVPLTILLVVECLRVEGIRWQSDKAEH
jgi:hypothetical protein